MNDEKQQKADIRQLLLVLGAAIGAAVLFSLFMIGYYGPSGEYYAKNILLSPEMTGKLDFRDGVTGGKYTFDKAVFRYYDDEAKSWKSVTLNKETYKKVFTFIENESSIKEVTPEIMNQFNLPNPATLSLTIKNDKITKVFQDIVFVKDGDLYRIQLRGDTPTTTWAYFHQRKIYDHILHTIVPPGEL